MNLSAKDLKWERMAEDTSDYLGKLKGHSAVVHENCMYIFGGQPTDMTSNNNIYQYNFSKNFWRLLPGGSEVPRVESHNAVVCGDTMYVLNGYIV